MSFPFYITYDDRKIRDGFGAQGLRVVRIFLTLVLDLQGP
jgi:hypothetical protein